jgi:hypothetical protein
MLEWMVMCGVSLYVCVCRTELCAFSEYRIYPGHGVRFIRRDGQVQSVRCCFAVIL